MLESWVILKSTLSVYLFIIPAIKSSCFLLFSSFLFNVLFSYLISYIIVKIYKFSIITVKSCYRAWKFKALLSLDSSQSPKAFSYPWSNLDYEPSRTSFFCVPLLFLSFRAVRLFASSVADSINVGWWSQVLLPSFVNYRDFFSFINLRLHQAAYFNILAVKKLWFMYHEAFLFFRCDLFLLRSSCCNAQSRSSAIIAFSTT